MTAIAVATTTTTSAASLRLTAFVATDATTPDATAPTSDPTQPSKDPLDRVNLSDHAKATLARARVEQSAADKLTALVQSGKNPNGKSSATSSTSSDTTSSDKITASFVKLAGITDADLAPSDEPTVPKVSFSNSFGAFGFSVSATGNADAWSSDIQIRGPKGVQAWNTIWGGGKGNPTAGGGGASGLAPGQGFESSSVGGTVTFTFADAQASGAAVATRGAVASTGSASFNATKITVDFSTGNISMERTNMSATTTTLSVNQYA
jgi:hypothetical protein